jgi:BirA family transcriptional regulator, biotin operon repressor / biotin---[acetyl-CoA-carboxylase] ligase
MDRTLHYITRTTSTQQEARRLIETGIARLGDVIVADEQTAGRGRFGRTWISPRGGLYATIILGSDPLLSLKAGLALVHVLRRAGVFAELKWPNDLLVGNLKIAGILIEAINEFSLVGIGLNLTSAPLDTATYVTQYVNDGDRDEWAQWIAKELVEMTEASFDMDAYRAVCATLGRHVRLEGVGDDPPVEGIALDVDDQGRLIVNTATGKRVISSGECLHLRSLGENSCSMI